MKITALQEYGLRCMVQLAGQAEGTPLTVRHIAGREKLTPVYVEKILVHLRRAGLVRSLRGVNGGYVLVKTPDQISVAEVLGTLGRLDLGGEMCDRFKGSAENCVHSSDCSLRPLWGFLSRSVYGFLEKLSLLQLVQSEPQVLEDMAQLHWRGTPLSLAKGRPLRAPSKPLRRRS